MPGALRPRFVARSVTSILLLASLAAHAQITFDLPSQPLARSLVTVANLGNVNLLYDPDVIDGLQAPALKANVSADEALTRLLEGTGLSVVHADGNTVRVVNRKPQARPAGIGSNYTPPPIRLAEVSSAAADESSAPSERSPRRDARSSTDEQEVLVTAEKRTERLQDVPVPVTTISTEKLLESNQLSLQDYYTSVPGLNLSMDNLRGQVNVSIRGLSLNGASPTVGIVVDDIPYGSSTSLGGGNWMPDLDPSDLARVEVLRGPQGTLYGASSIGGLLKYVTVDPSTSALTGSVQASGSSIRNGSGLGYGVRGSVNIPLTDTLAMRVSAFTRKDPGYIDDPVLHLDGVDLKRSTTDLVGQLGQLGEKFACADGSLTTADDAESARSERSGRNLRGRSAH